MAAVVPVRVTRSRGRVRVAGRAVADWWLDPVGRHDESSNALIFFFALLPMVMAAFGLGFDIMRNTYMRGLIQDRLDQAVSSGVTVTSPDPADGGLLILSRDPDKGAARVVEQVYQANRVGGGLLCIGDRSPVLGGGQRCWKKTQVVVGRERMTYGVQERTKNFFLTVVGIDYQDYTLVSEGQIQYRNT